MDILSVSLVGEHIRQRLESDEMLADLWVQGEIVSASRSPRGHHYFTLRDDAAQLRAVLFQGIAARIATQPMAGDSVIVHGRISWYEPTGSGQLVVDRLFPAGVGESYLRFEALKLRLEQEGLFAPERKRPLPPMPRHVGLVTSRSGAVYHDVVNVLSRRYPLAELVFVHSSVQGELAPLELVQALQTLSRWRSPDGDAVDVAIVGRGGGAPEELAVFNDERVARAVFAFPSPIISAVGHETDTTICDYVADARAPTPSAAAEIATPSTEELLRDVTALRNAVVPALHGVLARLGAELDQLDRRLGMASPRTVTSRYRERVEQLVTAGRSNMTTRWTTWNERLSARTLQLRALDPRATLARGYAIVTHAAGSHAGQVVLSARQVLPRDELEIQMTDGMVPAVAGASIAGPPQS
ncbi:MAG: exodeoxyribonuclease VII large subunit [Chloroflexota bacterium]